MSGNGSKWTLNLVIHMSKKGISHTPHLHVTHNHQSNTYSILGDSPMGTDRSNIHSDTCLCGKGTVKIDSCSPDHGWPTSNPHWYEHQIRCSTCSKTYEIEQRGKHFVYVERKELQKLEALSKKAYKLGEGLMIKKKVSKLLTSLVNLLESQSSMAATHRLLCGANLEHTSINTFRRSWRGVESWVNSYVSHYNLDSVMSLLGVTDKDIEKTLSEINKLRKASNAKVPVYGKPIYTAND